jgi:hypothetical protein
MSLGSFATPGANRRMPHRTAIATQQLNGYHAITYHRKTIIRQCKK